MAGLDVIDRDQGQDLAQGAQGTGDQELRDGE
jgi:hypothetical protein